MKISIITSAAFVGFALMGTAMADILPNAAEVGTLPQNSQKCAEWAGTDSARMDYCDALANCETNESDDRQTLIDCIVAAEAKYHESLGAGMGAPYLGEQLPVSTNAAEADYSKQGPDTKGWKNAEQGF